MSNNVVDITPYLVNRTKPQEDEEFEEFLAMFILEQEIAVNDNFSETFEDLLEYFIPETVDDYETFFNDTFEDFTIEVWFNPETGEFEDNLSY